MIQWRLFSPYNFAVFKLVCVGSVAQFVGFLEQKHIILPPGRPLKPVQKWVELPNKLSRMLVQKLAQRWRRSGRSRRAIDTKIAQQ